MKYFALAFLLCFAFCNAQSAVEEDETPYSCTPLERFDKECNDCQCSVTGTWAQCGANLCDPEDNTKQLEATNDCKDNDRFNDGCNDCFCANGKFACTLQGCHKILGKKEIIKEQPAI